MSKSKIIMLLVVVVLIVVAGLWISRMVVETPDQIRVGYMKIAAHLPVVAAREEGIFEEFGLDVGNLELFSDTPSLMQALITDRVDVAFQVTPDIAWSTAGKNQQKLFIYFVAQSTEEQPIDGLYALEAEGDLEGKTIGVFPGPTASAFMSEIMKKAYELEPDQYDLRPIPPPLQLNLLRNREIDALFTYEPLGTLAQARTGAVTLLNAPVEQYVVNPWNGGVGIFGEPIVQYRPKVACKFAAAIATTVSKLAQEPELAAKHMAALQPGLTPDLAMTVPLTRYYFVEGISAEKNLTLGRAAIQRLLDNQLSVYTRLGILDSSGRLDYLEVCEE